MPDEPGATGLEPEGWAAADVDGGWGSPLPAEYGSLHDRYPAASDGAAGRSVGPGADGDTPADGSLPAGRAGGRFRPAKREGRPLRSAARRGRPAEAGGGAGTDGAAPAEDRRGRSAALLRRIEGASAVDALAVAGLAAPDGARPAVALDPTGLVAPHPLAPDGAGPDGAEVDGSVVAATLAAPMPSLPPLASPTLLSPAAPVEDLAVPLRRPGRRAGRSRTRATVRHVDVFTVARVSVLFYIVILLALVTASVLLWVFADLFGALPSIEKSVRSLFSLKTFVLHPTTVALYTSLAGLVLCVAGTLANVLAAIMYNLISDVVGGVRVELESPSRE